MVAYAKRNAAIATSIGAMLVSMLLIIFFGAWAVSASSDADLSGVLSSATAGFSGQPLADSPQSNQSRATASASDAGNVPRLASSPAAGSAPADTWWGKALLGACPLH